MIDAPFRRPVDGGTVASATWQPYVSRHRGIEPGMVTLPVGANSAETSAVQFTVVP